MDARTRQIIVVIHNHEIVFADKKVSKIVDVMKGIEPDFVVRQTLSEHLERYGFYFFINRRGKVYQIYIYLNPLYKDQKRKPKNA